MGPAFPTIARPTPNLFETTLDVMTPPTAPAGLPKLIVTDLDGTLLPENKELTTKTRAVLGELAARGVGIAIATGKFFHLTLRYADGLGPGTAVVALDGARNRFARENGSARGIGKEIALSLLEAWDAPHLAMFADSGGDEMLLRFNGREVHPSIQAWASRIRHVRDAREHLVGDPALLAFYGDDTDELRAIVRASNDDYPGLRAAMFDTSAYGTARVVIQQRGVTKGSGVLELCRFQGVAPEECMVFGDWHNDLSMFEVGCINVAMVNAVPELRERAHHITERNNEADGVAHFLARAFL